MTQRDVPAATRGMLSLLKANGELCRETAHDLHCLFACLLVSLLVCIVAPVDQSMPAGIIGFSSGVNTASLPPHVPRAFLWRDVATNSDIITTVHPFGYGGISVADCVVLDCKASWSSYFWMSKANVLACRLGPCVVPGLQRRQCR